MSLIFSRPTASTFGVKPLEKGRAPLFKPAKVLILLLLSFYKDGNDIKSRKKVDTSLKKKQQQIISRGVHVA